ncbi:unnamed protein product [Caenorhabditis sp. 36 PRJEB53466]|nr:unnamed protein product [Caenorhabditis sp. 36 PRJEB53466]
MNSLLILSLLCVAVSAHIFFPPDICISQEDCPFPQICFRGKCVFGDPLVSRTFYGIVGQASEENSRSFENTCQVAADCGSDRDGPWVCVFGKCVKLEPKNFGLPCTFECPIPGQVCVHGVCQ